MIRQQALPSRGGSLLRERGAASVAVGRTPHEVRDEMCRAMCC